MRVRGAIIKEQGVKFVVVLVKKHIVDDKFNAEKAIRYFSPRFSRVPIILAAQDHRGQFTYCGRKDISKFLASIHPSRIPWREYIV